MRSWYGLCHCFFEVKKGFTDRLSHQSTTALTQPKRNSKALQCPGISPNLWGEAVCYIHVLSFLHHKYVDSLNACINLIWTHTSYLGIVIK